MNPDRRRKISELCEAALKCAPEDRASFLDRACEGDRELRREVEKMLSGDEQATEFMQTDEFEVAARLSPRPRVIRTPSFTSDSIDDARFIPGDVLSERYRIVGLLGRGGMGEVYRGDDLQLKQPVAPKVLPASLSANGASLARFYTVVSVVRQITPPSGLRGSVT